MRILLLITLALICFEAHTQNLQKEINEQVWKPFITNFNEHNTDGFMAVHSKDAVRSPRDAKVVWNWGDYKQQQAKGDQRDVVEKRKRSLELRFTERISNKDLAIEVGVYKTTYFLPNGETQNYYGRFHVVLRKESDTWKILVDTDYSEGGTIGEKDFLASQPLDQ
jgi:ketosteroid isomerase-like protein